VAGRGAPTVNPALMVGTTVWLVLLGLAAIWLLVLVVYRPALSGPRAIARWLLSSWPSRLTVLALWGIAGWHVFCQRP
jgi:hypothetical protein